MAIPRMEKDETQLSIFGNQKSELNLKMDAYYDC